MREWRPIQAHDAGVQALAMRPCTGDRSQIGRHPSLYPGAGVQPKEVRADVAGTAALRTAAAHPAAHALGCREARSS